MLYFNGPWPWLIIGLFLLLLAGLIFLELSLTGPLSRPYDDTVCDIPSLPLAVKFRSPLKDNQECSSKVSDCLLGKSRNPELKQRKWVFCYWICYSSQSLSLVLPGIQANPSDPTPAPPRGRGQPILDVSHCFDERVTSRQICFIKRTDFTINLQPETYWE